MIDIVHAHLSQHVAMQAVRRQHEPAAEPPFKS